MEIRVHGDTRTLKFSKITFVLPGALLVFSALNRVRNTFKIIETDNFVVVDGIFLLNVRQT